VCPKASKARHGLFRPTNRSKPLEVVLWQALGHDEQADVTPVVVAPFGH
jgi:hypothetical protein